MPSAREDILSRLRRAVAQQPTFPNRPQAPYLPVTRLAPDEDLKARFIAEVERVKGTVHVAPDDAAARRTLRELLAGRNAQRVTMWDEAHIPLPGVTALLQELGIERIQGSNAEVATADAGITGADWAIATTGTLVLSSGPGKPRMASLLPPVHIAVLTEDRIVPRLEDYIAAQRAQRLGVFRRSSNVTLITGSSRTSDIEMHPVFGVHGPLELHVILIENLSEMG
ncbi:MAG: lactate utilization protein [Anaerolineae bacterium]|nr:lactate utilization protein [Candidatus Roseilinea sp.]MDW8451049.1 lactate utilization protein [Anaerolineae bacterium]